MSDATGGVDRIAQLRPVSIPVKLYSATAPKDVRFHQYQGGTGRRVRYRRMAAGPSPEAGPAEELRPEPAGEPEVAWQDIVKGFEIEPGRVVTVTPDDLERLAPERTRVLEVEEFVDLREIDPVYFEKSYYVAPQPGVAPRPY